MTDDVWIDMYNADPRIVVMDGLRYMDYSSPEAWLISSEITLRYIQKLFEEAKKFDPDWIVIDGSEEYVKICEMVMRYRNNLSMTQGVQWTLWKERRLYIKNLFNTVVKSSKKGVIYTAYVGRQQKIVDGVVKDTKEQPKWVDIIKEQTHVTIRVRSRQGDKGRIYMATIENSKWRAMKTGAQIDITIPEGTIPNCLERLGIPTVSTEPAEVEAN